MANLNFLNIEDCSDVSIDAPTEGYQYIDYMTGNLVKDVSSVCKYSIHYANNGCEVGDETTINVAPLYDFQVTKLSCTGSEVGSIYTMQIKGINPDLIQLFEFCASGLCLGFALTYAVTGPDTITFTVVIEVPGTTEREFQIHTTCGFVYKFVFDLLGQTGTDTCDATLNNVVVTYPTPPAIVATPSSTIDANLLFSKPILFAGLYKVRICELTTVSETCIVKEQFINCGSFTCPTNTDFVCDDTDDLCNLTKEVVAVYQGIIFGLQCCKQSKLNIMKHYTNIVCPITTC